MDTDKLIELATENGWRVQRRRNGHLMFQHKTVLATVFASGTPSDRRSHLNALAKMKRMMRQAEQGRTPR